MLVVRICKGVPLIHAGLAWTRSIPTPPLSLAEVQHESFLMDGVHENDFGCTGYSRCLHPQLLVIAHFSVAFDR
jgi:hypothetical protein